MAGNSEVLREYLLSLGFRVNVQESKKFDTTVRTVEKSVNRLGIATAGVAVAAVAMVQSFANSMERLYYASRRTGASVENIQALEFAGKQIGLAGGVMTQSLAKMAMSLRSSPGLAGVLKSFGVKVEGRDMSDVARDAVREFAKMPFYVGSRFAAMFGMDPDTFLQISQNQKELDEAFERRLRLNREMGVDSEKVAEAFKEWNNELRAVGEHLDIAKGALATALLPFMKELSAVTKLVADDWTRILSSKEGLNNFGTRMREGLTGVAAGDRVKLSADAKRRIEGEGDGTGFFTNGAKKRMAGWMDRFRQYGNPNSKEALATRAELFPQAGAGGKPAAGAAAAPASDAAKQALMRSLEQRYSLPEGLLDSVYSAESGRGKYLRSSAGAKGPFQFMPNTAKEFGIEGREDDFDASADAAARKYQGLLRMYGGDVHKAAAAYNWGQGNMRRVGDNLGSAPAETQGYAAKIAGGIIQHNAITVYGADAKTIAAGVGGALDSNNAKLLQDLKGAVR